MAGAGGSSLGTQSRTTWTCLPPSAAPGGGSVGTGAPPPPWGLGVGLGAPGREF